MAVYMVVVARIPEINDKVVEYGRRTAPLVKQYGGEYLLRGGPVKLLEGEWPAERRMVVSKWPDMAALDAFWNSTEYQTVNKPIRAGTGQYDVAVYSDDYTPPPVKPA
jgi:uncharacterized protein (DUF1330 family)